MFITLCLHNGDVSSGTQSWFFEHQTIIPTTSQRIWWLEDTKIDRKYIYEELLRTEYSKDF